MGTVEKRKRKKDEGRRKKEKGKKKKGKKKKEKALSEVKKKEEKRRKRLGVEGKECTKNGIRNDTKFCSRLCNFNFLETSSEHYFAQSTSA
jgi:hypothetical protein